MKKLFGLTIAALLIPVAALGATYSVPGDFATIQAAINGAPAGSTVMVAAGTYYESLQALNLAKSLYLKTAGAPGATKIDGRWTSTLLRIENGDGAGDVEKNLVFDGFTFQNGIGSTVAAPVTIASAKPAFLNCTFDGNYSPISGGAVVIYGQTASPVFTNCTFANNRAGVQGGAVVVSGGHCQASFKKCLFQANSCATASGATYNEGGALYFGIAGGQVVDCTFTGNSSDYTAGAIMVLTFFTEAVGDVVTIKGSKFENNSCKQHSAGRPEPSEGGAIMAEANVTVVLQGCFFKGNSAETGGAIQSYRANLDIADCAFDANQANGTGYAYGGAITVNTDDGGDADRREADVKIVRTIIRSNTGAAAGGILYGGDGTYGKNGNLTLTDVTVDANSASSSSGGGIYLNRSTCTATRVNVLRNSAALYGGGIVLVAGSILTLNDSVVAGNSAASANPAIHNDGGSYTLNNTTLAYNNGSPAASLSVLSANPAVTVGGNAYLTYLVAPYAGSPAISPSVGSLSNLGGYAAGTAAVASLAADTLFTMTSAAAPKQASVTYTADGLTDAWFKGSPLPIPGRIEAEDFDLGGKGVAYVDATATNAGGSSYRAGESVDLYASAGASNGTYVASVSGGEYLDYTVAVAVGQLYDLQAVVASAGTDGRYYLQVDGVDVTGIRSVANTGGAQNWGSDRVNGINLAAGQHLVRLVIVQGEFSVDAIDWSVSTPWLEVSPQYLTRAARQGRTPPNHTITVRNAGAGTVNYTVSDNAGWLSLDTLSGSSTGESDTITVHYDTAALRLGPYTATISVTSPDAPNSPQSIQVNLVVVEDGRAVNDFDGDGRSDIGCYYAPGGNWYVFSTTDGFWQTAFGYAGTVPVTGDFDGDGVSDIGVYHPPSGSWNLFKSRDGVFQATFGFDGTIPIVGDFDGDGVSDVGCYYPAAGTWYIFRSRDGFYDATFGFEGTIPFVGDFDGDGVSDVGCYYAAAGKWYIFRSRDGFYEATFGFEGTTPFVGDFDGDGISDVGCYYPAGGNWYIFKSRDGFYQATFGFEGCEPIVGDFDGDNVSDIGCYHAASGNWYLYDSTEGFTQSTFGFEGTVPIGGTLQ